MRKLVHYLVGVLSLPLMFACSADRHEPRQTTSPTQVAHNDQLLATLKPYVRSKPFPKGPKPFSEERLRALSPDAPDLRYQPYSYLGTAYTGGEATVVAGCKNQVINLASLIEDKAVSRHLYNRAINSFSTDRQAFANKREIQDHVLNLEQVVEHFGFDFLFLSSSEVSLYQKLFQGTRHSNLEASWGRWDISYLAHQLGMETSLAAIQRIGATHIDPTFLYNIYNAPISSYADANGSFVITRYTTGAMLSVLYGAKTILDIDEETRVRLLSEAMGASLSWKGTAETQAISDKGFSLRFGNGRFTVGSEYKKKLDSLSDVKCLVRVMGGNTVATLSDLKGAILLKDAPETDLTPWVRSLADTKTHGIVQIDKGGLVPLSAFLLEENFKERLQKEASGNLPKRTTMNKDPHIQTCFVKWSFAGDDPGRIFGGTSAYNPNTYAPLIILYSRFGDRLIFANDAWKQRCQRRMYGAEEEYMYMKEAMDEAKSAFDDFDISPNLSYLDRVEQLGQTDLNIVIPFNFSGKIYKYLNPQTNMWYIYDRENKVALSFYDNDGDEYVLETYSLGNWFEKLPERKLSTGTLLSYRVIGI